MANFHIQESFNRVAAIMVLLKSVEHEMTKENSYSFSVLPVPKEQRW